MVAFVIAIARRPTASRVPYDAAIIDRHEHCGCAPFRTLFCRPSPASQCRSVPYRRPCRQARWT
jgi:hypothetical protein